MTKPLKVNPYSAENWLRDIHKDILFYLKSSNQRESSMIKDIQSPMYTKSQVKGAIRDLASAGLVKKEKDSSTEPHASSEDIVYRITTSGQRAIANNLTARYSVNNFSHITNSNISNQSSNVCQNLDVQALDQDLKDKIQELGIAIEKRDSSGIKKAFAYIADKSVDIAIAILTRGILS